MLVRHPLHLFLAHASLGWLNASSATPRSRAVSSLLADAAGLCERLLRDYNESAPCQLLCVHVSPCSPPPAAALRGSARCPQCDAPDARPFSGSRALRRKRDSGSHWRVSTHVDGPGTTCSSNKPPLSLVVTSVVLVKTDMFLSRHVPVKTGTPSHASLPRRLRTSAAASQGTCAALTTCPPVSQPR